MNAPSGAALEDTTPGYAADAPQVEAIPTCARGLAVAAGMVVVVGIAALAAISAFRSPLERDVPAPVLVAAHEEDIGELDGADEAGEASMAAGLVATTIAIPTHVDSTRGVLVLPPAAYGHRVFVEDRVVASASAELPVPCGRHRIRIGSVGRDRQIVVPCGGNVLVTYP